MRTSPPLALRKPAMTFRSVVLPQPDGPTTQTNSPALTSKFTPSKTSSLAPFMAPGKVTERSRSTILDRAVSLINKTSPRLSVGERLESPTHFVGLLELSDEEVENEADEADENH